WLAAAWPPPSCWSPRSSCAAMLAGAGAARRPPNPTLHLTAARLAVSLASDRGTGGGRWTCRSAREGRPGGASRPDAAGGPLLRAAPDRPQGRGRRPAVRRGRLEVRRLRWPGAAGDRLGPARPLARQPGGDPGLAGPPGRPRRHGAGAARRPRDRRRVPVAQRRGAAVAGAAVRRVPARP